MSDVRHQGDRVESAPQCALFAVLAAAGVVGAAGVSLAAVAAHKVESPALGTAATMLMIHAAAATAIAVAARSMQSSRRWLITAGLMLAAVTLFSGAVAFHAVTGNHIFPRAAPIGGTTLIASWCAMSVVAILEALGRR